MVDKKAMQKLFDKEGKAFISSDGVWIATPLFAIRKQYLERLPEKLEERDFWFISNLPSKKFKLEKTNWELVRDGERAVLFGDGLRHLLINKKFVAPFRRGLENEHIELFCLYDIGKPPIVQVWDLGLVIAYIAPIIPFSLGDQVVLNFGWHRSQSRELSHA